MRSSHTDPATAGACVGAFLRELLGAEGLEHSEAEEIRARAGETLVGELIRDVRRLAGG